MSCTRGAPGSLNAAELRTRRRRTSQPPCLVHQAVDDGQGGVGDREHAPVCLCLELHAPPLEPRCSVCRPVGAEEGALELPVAPGVLGGQGLGEQQAGGTRGDAHTVG